MKAILFDLDGTLLDLNIEKFFQHYFSMLEKKMADIFPPQEFTVRLLKSTEQMMKNTDPRKTNKEVFFQNFFKDYNIPKEEVLKRINDFYQNDFCSLAADYGPVPGCHEVLDTALKNNYDIVLATNPVFPKEATKERMRWARIDSYPFKLITTYEFMCACKPNLQYYQQILDIIDIESNECIMVGNDSLEDMVAGSMGMKTYLVEDMAILRNNGFTPDFQGNLSDFVQLLNTIS